MKLTLLTPALTAILGLALASAPLPTYAQTETTTASTAPAATSSTNSTSTKPKKPAAPRTAGEVTAIDTAGNTISVENKKDGTREFSIASTAKITKDRKPATLADFAVGDKVFIAYTTDASGTLTATQLSKTTPKPKPTPTPAKSTPTTTTPSTPPAQ